MTNEIREQIVREVSLLKNDGDCIGIPISEKAGIFVQIVDYGDGFEYLIELNRIDFYGAWIPSAKYNAFSNYGNIDMLLETIQTYLKDNEMEE